MEEIKELTQDEVFNVLDYVSTFYQTLTATGYYDSDIEHNNLINLNNISSTPTQTAILQALHDYRHNEQFLIDCNQFMNTMDGIFNSTIRHYSSLLTFDISDTCINAYSASDWKSNEYKKDVRRKDRFLKDFNTDYEFPNVFKNMLLNDVYFTWLRDSEGSINDDTFNEDIQVSVKKTRKKLLQEMPQSFCQITGRGSECYLYDFDLRYFSNSNVSVENFDPSLMKMYLEKIKDKDVPNSIVLDNSGFNITNNNSYGYTRVSPNDGAWCWKFDSSKYNTLPPLSFLLKNALDNDTISKLQKDKDMISANALILGEIKTKNNDKSSNDKDAFTINPKFVAQLMALARKGINRNIKQIAMPTGENKLFQFQDNNSNMYKNQLQTTASLGASASSLVYNDGTQAQFALQSAIVEDYAFVKDVYSQFENFLNFYVNKKTKKYKFKFKVTGCIHPFMRDNEFDKWMKLSAVGIQPNVSKWASLMGVKGYELQSMIDEMRYTDTIDKLKLLLNTNTKDDGTSEGGRPQSDEEKATANREYL